MKRSAAVKYLVFAIALFGPAPDGLAADLFGGWISLYEWEGETTLEFDGRRRTGDDGVENEMDLEEGVRLKRDGHILDPRIGTFSAGTRFAFEQGRHRKTNGDTGARSATLIDYDVSASFLHGTTIPWTVSGLVAHNTGTYDGELGSRTESANDNRNVSVFYRNPYFPTSFAYSERLRDETRTSGLSGTVTEREDVLRTVEIEGRSKKLFVTLEQDWFGDRKSETNRNYIESRATADHNLRWGRGSNLHSRIYRRNRTGSRVRKNLDITEQATLRHSSKLESHYSYGFQTLGGEAESTSNNASVGVTHRLYNNLTTSVSLSGSASDSDSSEVTNYAGNLNLNYQKVIFGDGNFTASIGGGYGVTDRVSKEELSQTVDESQTVPTSLIVLLNERFIETATIVVTNAAGAIVYTEGTDYTIIAADGDRTELEILAAGGISNGDTILIDYSFRNLPTQKYAQIPYNFGLRIDFPRYSAYTNLSGQKETLISGQDASALSQRFDITTGGEMRWDWTRTRARFSAEHRYGTSGELTTRSISFRQSMSHTISRSASLTAGANQNFQSSSGRSSQTYTTNAALNWRAARGLNVRFGLNAWLRNSTGGSGSSGGGDRSDKFVRADATVRWRVRAVDLSLEYNHDYRAGTTTSYNEDRLMIRVARKF